MLEHHACVTARCDQCGRFYGDDLDTGAAYFRTAADALEVITMAFSRDEVTWVVSQDGRLRCAQCESQRLCTESGHNWSTWLPCLPDGADEVCSDQFRYCRRYCDAHEVKHGIAPGSGEAA